MDAATVSCPTSDNIISHDFPEAIASFNDLIQQTKAVTASVEILLRRVRNNEFKTSKGISFLEVKYQMLLNYLVNLTYLIHRKVIGKSINGETAIDRLTESRTVLEKMRPIDQKLKYQIDKLLKTSVAGNICPDDPLYLKANIGNTLNKLSDEEISNSDSDGDDDEEKVHKKEENKSKLYVAPKLSAVQYDGDETVQDQRQKMLERVRKRALNSSIMQELRREYDEGPEEIWDAEAYCKLKHKQQMKEREEYEEKYMTRLPLTKKQKQNVKQFNTISSLGSLAKFENISGLDASIDDMPLKKKKTGRKQMNKRKGGKKGFRRKRH